MEENLEWIDESFLVLVEVVNTMNDNALHRREKIEVPMDQEVMVAEKIPMKEREWSRKMYSDLKSIETDWKKKKWDELEYEHRSDRKFTWWSSIGNAEKHADILWIEWISRSNIISCSTNVTVLRMPIDLEKMQRSVSFRSKITLRKKNFTWKMGGGPNA